MLAATKGNTGMPNLVWSGRSSKAAAAVSNNWLGHGVFFFPKAGPVAGESNDKIVERRDRAWCRVVAWKFPLPLTGPCKAANVSERTKIISGAYQEHIRNITEAYQEQSATEHISWALSTISMVYWIAM